MKQLIIGQSKAYSSVASAKDLTAVPVGVIGFYKLSDNSLITAKATEDFMVVLGRGADHAPLVFPEVSVDTLEVTKATDKSGVAFTATIAVPATVVKDEVYSIRINKTDVVFNERNSWSFDAKAKSTTGSAVAADLRKAINAVADNLGLTVSGSGVNVIVTAKEVGKGYTMSGMDGLMGVSVTSTPAEPAILDTAYVKDLASRCAAGKGFVYTSQEGRDIYPGYPEEVPDGTYVEYTLRFAVGRKSAKTRDEVVSQLLHIVVPKGSACITDIDKVLGITNAAA